MLTIDQTARRLLVIAPHADDEVLGAGGLMARLASDGWQIHVLYGVISGYRSLTREDASTNEVRTAEVEAALRVLGAAEYQVIFCGEEYHLRLDCLPLIDLIQEIEACVSKFKPTVAVIPCRGHHHQDHARLADACIAALRPAAGSRLPLVPSVLAYGHTAMGWGGDQFVFKPNVFCDVREVMETKLEALRCYQTQICAPPHPRSPEMIRHWSAVWGGVAGLAYAEPYECLRIAF